MTRNALGRLCICSVLCLDAVVVVVVLLLGVCDWIGFDVSSLLFDLCERQNEKCKLIRCFYSTIDGFL